MRVRIIFSIVFSFVFVFLFLFSPQAAGAARIDFFYSAICPHCAEEEVFLDRIEQDYSEVEIKRYEVYYNAENRELFEEVASKLKLSQLAVPLTIIGDKYFLGYQDDQTTGQAIENYLQSVLGEPAIKAGEEETVVKVPLLGQINLSKMSLPALTFVLGALDGFNPCAMWVLLFLIALLINTRSRKRMWLIGGTFILVSGIVYYLILAAWLNLFFVFSYINLTRILIGVLAMAIGFWQIRNFLKRRPATCKITESKSGMMDRLKNKIRNQAEKAVFSPLTFGVLVGVAFLAVAVNLVEFFCSAGLPAIYTRILTLSELSTLSYYLYLLFYTFIFMLDDLIIFSLAVVTLSKIGAGEKYNYWITLIGGLLMLILGFLLIFKPELLMF